MSYAHERAGAGPAVNQRQARITSEALRRLTAAENINDRLENILASLRIGPPIAVGHGENGPRPHQPLAETIDRIAAVQDRTNELLNEIEGLIVG